MSLLSSLLAVGGGVLLTAFGVVCVQDPERALALEARVRTDAATSIHPSATQVTLTRWAGAIAIAMGGFSILGGVGLL